MNSPHVLVADDEPAVLALAERILADAGYRVTAVAGSVRAALLLTDPTRDFAAAVLDARMPALSGLQVLAVARRRGYAGPTLLVTGDPDPAIAAVAADLGAVVLPKPFRPADLVRAVGALTPTAPAAAG